MPLRSISIAATFICIYLSVQFLFISQSIVIPFVFAILIWNVLSTIACFIKNTPIIGQYIPRFCSLIIACLMVFWLIFAFGSILTENMQKIIVSSENLQLKLASYLQNILSTENADLIKKVVSKIDMQAIVIGFYATISNMMSSIFLIIFFVIFFFIEQNVFAMKLAKIFPKQRDYQFVDKILTNIPRQIQFYLGLKTLFSFITGLAIYVVLKLQGLAFAEFWAVAMFFMNFIPNIGAIAMTVIITLVGYFQWLDMSKTIILLGAQLGIHTLIGNFLETHYLGRTMHLSPLFILISLCFWGLLWGGAGLFLAVPMTVVLMIVLGSFDATRKVALILSEKGELPI